MLAPAATVALPQPPLTLAQIQELAAIFYTTTDQPQRAAAEKALAHLKEPDYFRQCQFLLDQSTSPFVLVIALTSLIKCFTANFSKMPPDERLSLRDSLLNHLATRGPGQQDFVLAAHLQLLCRVVKYSWLDDPRQQELMTEINRFFQVQEMSIENSSALTASQHRKIAISFRDKGLQVAFELALDQLKRIGLKTVAADSLEDKMRGSCLQLFQRCLSFDFLGTVPDEASDDTHTLQVPSTWAGFFESNLVEFLFQLYRVSQGPRCAQVMDCVVCLASVRRSVFRTDEDRDKFMGAMMKGIAEVLVQQIGLADSSNHHSFCRALLRFKVNYQLHQLIGLESYPEWIQQIASFTIHSFRSWQLYAPTCHSHYYLLNLWSRLVSSTYYVRGPSPSLIESLAPSVIAAYIASRMELVPAVLQSTALEDPLEDDEQLNEQLEALPFLGRCKYGETSELLLSIFDPLANQLQKQLSEPGPPPPSFQVAQAQLTWLVYIIGAVVGGRLGVALSDTEEYDVTDGELSSRVFRLMAVNDAALPKLGLSEDAAKMEVAFMYFIQQFRRVYIGDQAMASAKIVYDRLGALLGIGDHLMVLNYIITKIGANLKNWYQNRAIVEKTLDLFHDLGAGYSSSKVLIRIDQIISVFTHHTSNYFPFLDHPENSRCRTTFYATLAKLLFMEENIGQFEEFMLPFKTAFANVLSVSHSYDTMRQPSVKRAVVGLVRDLRGIASACSTRRPISLLFEWLYPTYTQMLIRIAEAYYDVPEVVCPLLKFFCEMVWNRQGRLNFECSSANGILLFRETSALLSAYGKRLAGLTPTTDAYSQRYKGIWLCMNMLTRTLVGNYVTFGVFALYNDPSLASALQVVIKLALSIPLSELLTFPKVVKAFYALLEALTEHHFRDSLTHLDEAGLVQVLVALREGIRSVDANICSQACNALDHLASYYVLQARKAGGQEVTQHLRYHPELLYQLLQELFELILYDDQINQWAVSRPIYSLSLLYPQAFNQIKEEFSTRRTPSHTVEMRAAFEGLMNDLQPNLEARNRDKFTQNISHFRAEARAWLT